jgi:hypothetical protein
MVVSTLIPEWERNHPQAAAVQMHPHSCAVFAGGRAARGGRKDRSEEFRRPEQGCRSGGHPGARGNYGGLRARLGVTSHKRSFQTRGGGGGGGGGPISMPTGATPAYPGSKAGPEGYRSDAPPKRGITRRRRLHFNVTRERTCRGNQRVTRPRRAGQWGVRRFMAMQARRVSSRG